MQIEDYIDILHENIFLHQVSLFPARIAFALKVLLIDSLKASLFLKDYIYFEISSELYYLFLHLGTFYFHFHLCKLYLHFVTAANSLCANISISFTFVAII